MINILDDFEVAQYCPALPQTVVVEEMDSQLIEIPSSTGLDLCEHASQDLALSTYVARLTFETTGKNCPYQQQISVLPDLQSLSQPRLVLQYFISLCCRTKGTLILPGGLLIQFFETFDYWHYSWFWLIFYVVDTINHVK